MASLLESVTSLMGQGQNMDALGSAIGADPNQTSSLLNAAGPMVLGGMADRANQPGGAGALMGMLGSGGLPNPGNLGAFLAGGDASGGSSMLDGIFGNNKAGMLSAVAQQTGLGSGLVGKALPMIAPIIMSVVAKRASGDKLDEAGLTRLLGSEQADLEKKGLFSKGMLGAAAAGAVGVGAAGAAAGKVRSMGGDATTAMGNVTDRAQNSVSAGASRVSGTVKTDGDIHAGGPAGGPRKGGFGWLGWVIGAFVVLAVLAWLLSQCGGDAGDVIEDGANAVEEAAEETVDAVEEVAEETAEVVEEAAEEVEEAVTGDEVDVDALQAEVDASLNGSGVTGVAADDGSVTLTGEVDSEDARTSAENTVAALAGVTSVNNQITVAEPEAAEEPAEAPATVNEALDLDPITFDVNSANITAEGQAVLDQAAEFFTANPDVEVEVAGHTDSDGDDSSNQTLSQARAESVRDYLVGKGIDAGRMTPVGYGESEPIADNATAEGKAENRRIEFRIL